MKSVFNWRKNQQGWECGTGIRSLAFSCGHLLCSRFGDIRPGVGRIKLMDFGQECMEKIARGSEKQSSWLLKKIFVGAKLIFEWFGLITQYTGYLQKE